MVEGKKEEVVEGKEDEEKVRWKSNIERNLVPCSEKSKMLS